MKKIHVKYNPMQNSIDINLYDGYILRIDCNQAETRIQTTPNSQRCLNALAIDNPLEYARLALDGEMRLGWMPRIVWNLFNIYALTTSSGHILKLYYYISSSIPIERSKILPAI